MRQSLWGVGFFFLLAASCGAPSVGSACTTSDTVTCKSSTEVYACIGGKWAIAPCGGTKGCTDSTTFNCDLSLGASGSACPPWAEGRTACQAIPPALVSCVGGTWQRSASCQVCSVASGAPDCINTGTGGGGGTTGGGGGTTGGGGGSGTCNSANCTGCCSNGQCFGPPLNGSTNFCGKNGGACDDCGARGQRCDSTSLACVASTSCNPTTCATGCCTNGQCFVAPLNTTDNFCGTGGAACSDCARLGLLCSASTFTCNPAQGTGGGGGATGGGGGAATGGGTATGGGGGTTDPCQGVPVGGQCVSSTLVRYCSIPTGSGTPSVQTYQCPGGSSCQPTGAGAACVQTGTCVAKDTRCATATTLQTCSSSGTWNTPTACGGGGCVGSAIGGDCVIAVATTTLTATLTYQSRSPKPDLTDWAAPVAVPARNVLVISMRGQNWIDATTTNASGQYTLKVPTTPGSTDVVVFGAFGGDGLGLRYAVEDPGLGTGTFSPGQQGQNVRYWNWSKPITALANGGITTISTAEGSGALNMYDLLQSIYTSSITNNQGRQGMTIAMLMGLGTEWSCGACFSESGSADFETNIWMPGGSQDEGYWSDYTIAHELGHWEMRSYGTAPNEGGSHTLTCPTFPGQAWSEGFATWHSAAVRNEPFLEDKQQGGFFWFDIGSRTYFPQSSSAAAITGPGGTNLLAQIDENAVSVMLWTLSTSRSTGAVSSSERRATMRAAPK